MKTHEFRKLLDWDEWANLRISRLLSGLEPGILNEPRKSGFSSILATFAHIVAAERVWLERWKGARPDSFPVWSASTDLADLTARLESVQSERRAWFNQLPEELHQLSIRYRNFSGVEFDTPLSDLLFHVVMHSAYHRGQIATMVRQAGAVPVSTDYVLFIRELDG